MEEIKIRLAEEADTGNISALYLAVTTALGNGENTAGWETGVYPTEVEAQDGVAAKSLYVAEISGALAGSVVLNSDFPPSYAGAGWLSPAALAQSLCVHTLCVRPGLEGRGIARALLSFAEQQAKKGGLLAVRFDTWENNHPAQRLYESAGYSSCGTVDLGLGASGMDNFICYEKEIV